MTSGRSGYREEGSAPEVSRRRELDVSDVFFAPDVGLVEFTARTVPALLTCCHVNSRWTSGGEH